MTFANLIKAFGVNGSIFPQSSSLLWWHTDAFLAVIAVTQ
jgi:hypothetical protein